MLDFWKNFGYVVSYKEMHTGTWKRKIH